MKNGGVLMAVSMAVFRDGLPCEDATAKLRSRFLSPRETDGKRHLGVECHSRVSRALHYILYLPSSHHINRLPRKSSNFFARVFKGVTAAPKSYPHYPAGYASYPQVIHKLSTVIRQLFAKE